MSGTKILHSMHRVHSQGVNMKIAEPHQGVFNKVATYTITSGIVKINSTSPGRFVFFSKIWRKIAEIITFRPKVIIHHIKYNSDTFLMTTIYQGSEGICPTVRILNTKRQNSIVTPIPISWKLRNRHYLNGSNTQIF